MALVFELFGDEGLLKAGVHYRWSYPEENQAFCLDDFALNWDPTAETTVRNFGPPGEMSVEDQLAKPPDSATVETVPRQTPGVKGRCGERASQALEVVHHVEGTPAVTAISKLQRLVGRTTANTAEVGTHRDSRATRRAPGAVAGERCSVDSRPACA